jgi:hypothetical protein
MTNENTIPWTADRLARVGLEIIDTDQLLVSCKACGKIWYPLIESGGGVNPRWWRCQNQCNANQRWHKS